jgi:hypothetical protein
MSASANIRSSAFAGHVGEKDSETIFGLSGAPRTLEVFEQSILNFLKNKGGGGTRTVTNFKVDQNRLDHTVYEKTSNGWVEISKYIYVYDEKGARSGPKFYKAPRFGASLELDHALEFEYEENNVRRSMQRQLNADGALMFTQYFFYNFAGERIEVRWIKPGGEVFRVYKYYYLSIFGLSFRQLLAYGENRCFDFLDYQLYCSRSLMGLRLNKWFMPALTLEKKFFFDINLNYTKSYSFKLFYYKRVIPFFSIIVRSRKIIYYK